MNKRPTFAQIASTYAVAASCGEPPTQAVAQTFEVALSTAGQWVGKVRRAGFLPPVTPGARVTRNKKAMRVADALGVDYIALTSAIREHAGGDLRL